VRELALAVVVVSDVGRGDVSVLAVAGLGPLDGRVEPLPVDDELLAAGEVERVLGEDRDVVDRPRAVCGLDRCVAPARDFQR
jgi:hypothetical protein